MMSNYTATLKTCSFLMLVDAAYRGAADLPTEYGMLRFADKFPNSVPLENQQGSSSPFGKDELRARVSSSLGYKTPVFLAHRGPNSVFNSLPRSMEGKAFGARRHHYPK
jgi:uncharacterized protein (DUF2267 family)